MTYSGHGNLILQIVVPPPQSESWISKTGNGLIIGNAYIPLVK